MAKNKGKSKKGTSAKDEPKYTQKADDKSDSDVTEKEESDESSTNDCDDSIEMSAENVQSDDEVSLLTASNSLQQISKNYSEGDRDTPEYKQGTQSFSNINRKKIEYNPQIKEFYPKHYQVNKKYPKSYYTRKAEIPVQSRWDSEEMEETSASAMKQLEGNEINSEKSCKEQEVVGLTAASVPSETFQENVRQYSGRREWHSRGHDFKKSFNNKVPYNSQNFMKGNVSNFQSRRSDPIKIHPQNREDNRKSKQRYSFHERREQNNRRSNFNNWQYQCYEDRLKETKGICEFIKTKEMEQDLFLISKEYSLAHCVAEDMSMGSGIAVHFRYKFKRIGELLNQHQQTGGLAILQDGDRYIYYLVTKKHSTGKPTYRTLFASLQALQRHIKENNIKKIAMPRIGCGLDRLEWDIVKFMIEYVFKETEVEIVICNLQQQSEDSPPIRHRNCKLTHKYNPIHTMEEGTIIIYLSTEDESISEEMKLLDEKFHFLTEFHSQNKQCGETVIFSKNEYYLLVGCVVRQTQKDPIDFCALQKCILNIKKINEKYQFGYAAFQAIKENDSCVNYKIINILRNALRDVEVMVCWVGELQEEMSSRDKWNESFSKTNDEDKFESKDGSGQKPARECSLTRKDKSKTEDNPWKANLGSEPKKFRSRRNLFEPKNEEYHARRDRNDEWNRSESTTSSQKSPLRWVQNSRNESRNVIPSQQSISNVNQERSRQVECNDDSDKYGATSTFQQSQLNWRNNSGNEPRPVVPSQQNISDVNQKRSRQVEVDADQLKSDETSLSQKSFKPSDSDTHTESGLLNRADESYKTYQLKRSQNAIHCKKIKEEKNISLLPERYAKVCYVTEDMCMQSSAAGGSIISNYIINLLKQNQREGNCAYLNVSLNYIYCLIVKKLASSSYNEKVVFSALKQLKQLSVTHRVRNLVVPAMQNSKQDPFDWYEIKYMLEFLFENVPIEVTLAHFPQEIYIETIKKENKNSLCHVKHPLFQTKKSIILYWASEDGIFTKEMESLKRNFHFAEAFRSTKKFIGNVIVYNQENSVLFGCVVKQKQSEPFNFLELHKCISMVNECNKTPFDFVAVQAVDDEDETINFKIIHILIKNLNNVTIKYCWPGNLKQRMP